MFTVLRAALTAGVLMVGSFPAFAQSSPIPDSPVPGIGGRDTRPGSIGSSPGSSGSSVGSNVGAGASAAPVGVDPRPAPDTAEAPPTRPLIGLSREIPVR
jgi:hypothetical protein